MTPGRPVHKRLYTIILRKELSRTVKVVDDILEALVFTNLLNDFAHRVWTVVSEAMTVSDRRDVLNSTPINVKMMSCEMTRNAK